MSAVESSPVVVVVSTAPTAEEARRIGSTLVEERLAACVNVLDGVTSIYRWKGGIERENEILMVMKTTSEHEERLRQRLVELHPYDVPEALVLGVLDGYAPYLDWVRTEVGADG